MARTESSTLANLRRWPIRNRLLLTLAIFIVYVLGFWLLFPPMGPSAIAFSVFPIVVTAWLFGIGGGLLGFLAAALIDALLLFLADDSLSDTMLRRGGGVGFLILFFCGIGFGFLSDIYAQLHRQLERRREIEISLRREKEFVEGMIRTARAAILVVDPQGCIVRFNPFLARLSGYDPEEVAGEDCFDLFLAPQDRERVRGAMFETLAGIDHTRPIPSILVAKNGRTYQIEWYDTLLRDEQGEITGVLAVGLNVTERERVKMERRELLAAEREQRLLAETLREVTLTLTSKTDLNAVLDEILSQAQRLVSHGTINIARLDRGILRIIRWQGYDGYGNEERMDGFTMMLDEAPIDRRVIESRQPAVVEDVREEPNWRSFPESRWIRAYMSVPICMRDRVFGVLRMDSDRVGEFSMADAKRLQPLANAAAIAIENAQLVERLEETVQARVAEIIAEQEKSEVILRSVDDAILMTGPDRTVQYVNPAFERMTGYAGEEVIGQPIDALDAWASLVSEPVLREAIARSGLYQEEIVVQRQDRREFDAALKVAPLVGVEAGVSGYVFSLRDITLRKDLERSRRRFITHVSHELRTPVTTMQLYVHLLQEREGLPEQVRHFLRAIEQETVRLSGLVEDVLTVVTLESGQVVDVWRSIRLEELVTSTVDLFRQEAEAADLSLRVGPFPQPRPRIKGDPARLGHALSEVLENAVTYTPPGGEVIVSTDVVERDGRRWVTITISDTGPGIPVDEQVKVFEEFYRGKITEDGHIPGSGLGLAMARAIVEAHGGQIALESEPGEGATVTIELLLAVGQMDEGTDPSGQREF